MQWLPLITISFLAIVFIGVRLLLPSRRRWADSGDESGFNRALYEEKVAELDVQVEAGELSAAERDALRVEYQRQLLADAGDGPVARASVNRGGLWLPLATLALVPVLAFGLYYYLGAADELELQDLLYQRGQLLNSGADEQRIAAATTRVMSQLETLYRRHPDDPLYPVLLARLWQGQGEFREAARYYEAALPLASGDAALHAEFAQALFFADGNRVSPRAAELARKAVQLEPGNDMALGLLGIEAFHNEDYRTAIEYWERALAGMRPMAPGRESLMAGIVSARERLGETADDTEPAAASPRLVVDVRLDDTLTAPADTTVFVYARAAGGSPMPLAIRRLSLGDLPTRVVLDETSAMSPAATIATANQVELVARVSFSGSAAAASGDLIGTLGPVDPGTADDPLSLVIDQRVP